MNSPADVPWVLGHRGARHAAMENTLAAFELARQEGARGSELDVQLSSDGHLFVVHDLDLARVTEGRDRRVVRQMSSQELDRVRLVGEHKIPRLTEVLHWARQHSQFINIELKTAAARRDRVAQATADLLRELQTRDDEVIVSSFHPLLLQRFRKAAPQIPSGFLFSTQHACLAYPTWPRLLGCTAVHAPAELLLRHPAVATRLAPYPINTWTVNDPGAARALSNLGVHAIISDCPGKILAALNEG